VTALFILRLGFRFESTSSESLSWSLVDTSTSSRLFLQGFSFCLSDGANLLAGRLLGRQGLCIRLIAVPPDFTFSQDVSRPWVTSSTSGCGLGCVGVLGFGLSVGWSVITGRSNCSRRMLSDLFVNWNDLRSSKLL
jgi:hypothetical protein